VNVPARSPEAAARPTRSRVGVTSAVDLLLAEEDAARKDAAAHPVRDAPTEQVRAASAGRVFTRHGGNVLPLLEN